MNRILPICVALAVAMAAIVWWWDSQPADAGAVGPGRPQPASATPLAPGLMTYEAPPTTKTPPPADLPRMLQLPDGDFVPALNGVRNPPRMEWPNDRPFSPIIGRVRTTELEWYVHADGTRSTTQMSFRTDLGRFDAVTTVANPAPLGQLPPGEPGTSR